MKRWGSKAGTDPWDRPEQRNAVDPWDRPEQKHKTPFGQMTIPIPEAVMTLVSFLLLSRLPDELAWRDYGTFFIAVFLFCVGFYRLIAHVPAPATKLGGFLRNGGICAASGCLLGEAVWHVYTRNGSEGSLYSATVFLIQSIAFLSGLDKGWTETRAARLVFRCLSIGLALLGLWLLVFYVLRDDSRDGLVASATLLWIASIVLFRMFGRGAGKEDRTIRHEKRTPNNNG